MAQRKTRSTGPGGFAEALDVSVESVKVKISKRRVVPTGGPEGLPATEGGSFPTLMATPPEFATPHAEEQVSFREDCICFWSVIKWVMANASCLAKQQDPVYDW